MDTCVEDEKKFLEIELRKKVLVNLTRTGHTEAKRGRGKHRVIYPTSFSMTEYDLGRIIKRQIWLRVTKNKKL